jgi:hypothetical protein
MATVRGEITQTHFHPKVNYNSKRKLLSDATHLPAPPSNSKPPTNLDMVIKSACVDVLADMSFWITRLVFIVAFFRPFMEALAVNQDVKVQI